MSRLHRSVAALVMAVALGLGATAGPAFGGDQPPPGPSPTTEVTPASTTTTTITTTTTPPATATTTPPATTTTTPPATTTTTTTVAAAPTGELADLRLEVYFDQPIYLAQEQITAHARVTNVGTVGARQAVIESSGNLSVQEWKPFWSGGANVDPGQTVEGSTTGLITTTTGPLTLTVTVKQLGGEPDATPADNTVTVSVPVDFVLGTYRGIVYGDANGNHAMDPGETLAGLKVRIVGGNPFTVLDAVTDATGRFRFTGVPAGTYSISFGSSDWYFTEPRADVDGQHDPDLVARGVPWLQAGMLAASMAFERQTHRVGDTAKVAVTLANNTTRLLTDLAAACEASSSVGVNAGALAADGPGVQVPAGSARTFDLTVPVTSAAAADGALRVFCSFGAPPSANGYVYANATTRVPGGLAPKIAGILRVYRYKPPLGPPQGEPLTGVKVWLRDQTTGRVIAEDVTAPGTGGFTFLDVPAGIYDFRVVGPWQPVWSDTGRYWDVSLYWSAGELLARDGENGSPQHTYWAETAPDQPDPDPGPTVTPAPPQASPPAGLAATGVDVTWLAVGGLLALAAGATIILRSGSRR